MDIVYTKETKLVDLQTAFQKRFNYLKIEFFRKKNEPNPKYTANDLLNSNSSLREVSNNLEILPLHITGLMKVRDVEIDFSEKLGLHVQIFRKSGKVWLITSSTDHLTLDEMNVESREKETPVSEENESSDYHEQE